MRNHALRSTVRLASLWASGTRVLALGTSGSKPPSLSSVAQNGGSDADQQEEQRGVVVGEGGQTFFGCSWNQRVGVCLTGECLPSKRVRVQRGEHLGRDRGQLTRTWVG